MVGFAIIATSRQKCGRGRIKGYRVISLGRIFDIRVHFLQMGGVSVQPSKTSVMNTIDDKTTHFGAGSGGQLCEMKECKKSYLTLVSN
jgi:hypothetical protein